MKETKCPFFKLLTLCFPMLKKKPSQEQQEIIDTVNDTIDQIQKWGNTLSAQSADEVEEKPEEQPEEKPEEQPEEKPEEKPEEQPEEKPEEKSQ